MSDKPSTRKTTRKKATTVEEAAEVLGERGRVATLHDLIPSVDVEKWIEVSDPNISNEKISLKIKKLVMSDLTAIGRQAKEDANETLVATIKYGVIEPKLHTHSIRSMSATTCMEIGKQIMEFSELRAEDIEQSKN